MSVLQSLFMYSQVDVALQVYEFNSQYNLRNIKKTSTRELDSAVAMAGYYAGMGEVLDDKEALSSLYAIRGNLRFELLRRKKYTNPEALKRDSLVKQIASDYESAIHYCTPCACDYLNDLEDFYFYTGDKQNYEQAHLRKKALDEGEDTPWMFGIELNYLAPKNIVGLSLCIGSYSPIKQKRFTDPETGKEYNPCGYNYPFAIGLMSLGVEKSLDNNVYRAYKFSPVWINAFVSLHPAQFTYAFYRETKSITWKPEAGLSFAGFSVNYAYSLAFNKEFTYVPRHMVSVKAMIPAIRWWPSDD